MSSELIDAIYDDALCRVECVKLPGMVWAGITVECPPQNDVERGYGYSPHRAALIACSRHGRLLDAEGEPIEKPDWDALFMENGAQIIDIASAWWTLNVNAQRQKLNALKKALAAGTTTS